MLFGNKNRTDSSEETGEKGRKVEDRPSQVSTKDWNLVLVNRDNKLPELNPQLTDVEEIKVDSRIAEQTRQFLKRLELWRRKNLLISGYRSVAEQTELYNERVAQRRQGFLMKKQRSKSRHRYSSRASEPNGPSH
ncbi:MAG: D-alanyl-D-alanine carboxypeptidase family protein [Streptococcus sp.]